MHRVWKRSRTRAKDDVDARLGDAPFPRIPPDPRRPGRTSTAGVATCGARRSMLLLCHVGCADDRVSDVRSVILTPLPLNHTYVNAVDDSIVIVIVLVRLSVLYRR